jgi:hypothetical protein
MKHVTIVGRLASGTLPSIFAIVETEAIEELLPASERRRLGKTETIQTLHRIYIRHVEKCDTRGSFDAFSDRLVDLYDQCKHAYQADPDITIDTTNEPAYQAPEALFPQLWRVMTGTGERRHSDGKSIAHRLDLLSSMKRIMSTGGLIIEDFYLAAEVNDVLKEAQRRPARIEADDLNAITETTNEDILMAVALAAYVGQTEIFPEEETFEQLPARYFE